MYKNLLKLYKKFVRLLNLTSVLELIDPVTEEKVQSLIAGRIYCFCLKRVLNKIDVIKQDNQI